MTTRPTISVNNQTVNLSVSSDACNSISVSYNVSPAIQLSMLGLQGAKGDKGADGDVNIAGTWIGLATGFKTTPVFNTTIAEGDVYDYGYDGVTYYRLVPSPYSTANDAFYETFSGGVLSNLIVVREVSL